MAISIAYQTYTGISLTAAYVRLTELKTTRTSVEMQWAVYKDQTAFNEGKPFCELIHKTLSNGEPEIVAVPGVEAVAEVLDADGNVITPAVDAVQEVIGVPAVPSMEDFFGVDVLDVVDSNPIKSAYLYLMSLPEFSTGTEI